MVNQVTTKEYNFVACRKEGLLGWDFIHVQYMFVTYGILFPVFVEEESNGQMNAANIFQYLKRADNEKEFTKICLLQS